MITPDTKSWTWVLERSCPECGFDASTLDKEEVAELLIELSETWERLLAQGTIHPGRPDDSTWSTLEYACHVRDVLGRFIQRIELMLDEDDPAFENWDQDATAAADDYEAQVPETVVAELAERAVALCLLLLSVSGAAWERTGRRSDGSTFTVDSIARYMVHDVVHHVADVRREDAGRG